MTPGMRQAVAAATKTNLAKQNPSKLYASTSSPASERFFEASGTGSVYHRQIARVHET